jgi:hypothetical protein
MNVNEFKELIDASTMIKVVGEYTIRKFKASDNYIIIDKIGDFLVLEEESVDEILTSIWEDFSKERLN